MLFLEFTRCISSEYVLLCILQGYIFYVVQPDFQMLFLAVLTEFILLAFLIVNFYLGWYKTYVGR